MNPPPPSPLPPPPDPHPTPPSPPTSTPLHYSSASCSPTDWLFTLAGSLKYRFLLKAGTHEEPGQDQAAGSVTMGSARNWAKNLRLVRHWHSLQWVRTHKGRKTLLLPTPQPPASACAFAARLLRCNRLRSLFPCRHDECSSRRRGERSPSPASWFQRPCCRRYAHPTTPAGRGQH